jgi:hypothetical protein
MGRWNSLPTTGKPSPYIFPRIFGCAHGHKISENKKGGRRTTERLAWEEEKERGQERLSSFFAFVTHRIGFFSFFGGGDSKPKGPSGSSLSTSLLAYGYITAYAKPDIITSRLDMHIISNILPHLDTKTVSLQQTLVKVRRGGIGDEAGEEK